MQISALGNIALSFHFDTTHEKVQMPLLSCARLCQMYQLSLFPQVVVQISALQCLALTMLVFTASCVRKPLLYGVVRSHAIPTCLLDSSVLTPVLSCGLFRRRTCSACGAV